MSNSDLPGTGGDAARRIDGTDEDVEGHRQKVTDSGEGARRVDGSEGALRRDGSDSALRRVDGSDEDDVEGHLFRMGPTTEGEYARHLTEDEFARRGPGENPHGDR